MLLCQRDILLIQDAFFRYYLDKEVDQPRGRKPAAKLLGPYLPQTRFCFRVNTVDATLEGGHRRDSGCGKKGWPDVCSIMKIFWN